MRDHIWAKGYHSYDGPQMPMDRGWNTCTYCGLRMWLYNDKHIPEYYIYTPISERSFKIDFVSCDEYLIQNVITL